MVEHIAEDCTPCIVCGNVLPKAIPGESVNQPYQGLMCSTRGNYGSTIFDPMDNTSLAFIVCDNCMIESATKGRVLLDTSYSETHYLSRTWNGPHP